MKKWKWRVCGLFPDGRPPVCHRSLCVTSCVLFLFLSGGRVKTWKRRWFILTDNCLYYFEYTTVSEDKHMCQFLCGFVCPQNWPEVSCLGFLIHQMKWKKWKYRGHSCYHLCCWRHFEPESVGNDLATEPQCRVPAHTTFCPIVSMAQLLITMFYYIFIAADNSIKPNCSEKWTLEHASLGKVCFRCTL